MPRARQRLAAALDVKDETPGRAARVRVFRRLHHLAQQLQFLADQLYRDDGITSQQAMLLGIVDALGTPSLTEAASAFSSSYQNVKQVALALERKGLLEVFDDPDDGRVRRLKTTAKNARHWASRDRDDFAIVAGWFGALSDREVGQLEKLIGKLKGGVSTAVAKLDTPAARRRSG